MILVIGAFHQGPRRDGRSGFRSRPAPRRGHGVLSQAGLPRRRHRSRSGPLAAACRRRFRAEIARGALHIIEGAIVSVNERKDGYIKFYKNPRETLWGTTNAAWRDRNARLGAISTEIEVPRLDFGAVLRRHGMLWRLGYRKFRAVQQSDVEPRCYEGHDRLGRRINHRFERGASGPFGADLCDGWMTGDELLVEYKWIFEMYRTFGDDSPFTHDRSLSEMRLELERRLQRPLPGWYDTHATF